MKQFTGVIYARTSNGKASHKETPIASQIAACQEWAKNNGVEVTAIFQDEEVNGFGEKAERKEFDNALNYVGNNDTDYFIVFDVSRFARTITHTVACETMLKGYNTKLIPVMSPRTKQMMPTGVIYARVADGSQESELKEQIVACQEWAHNNGVRILEVFEDRGVSGTQGREARQGFNDSLTYVEHNNIDYFIVFDLSKFSYSFEHITRYKAVLDKYDTVLMPISLLVGNHTL